MNKKLNLYLDFDSTIANSIKAYCDTYTALFHDRPYFKIPDPDKVACWNLSDECPLMKDNTGDIFGNKMFFDYLEFMDDADDVIRKLSQVYNITIVSIGSYDNIIHKSKWIKEKMPYIKNSILIVNEGCKMDKSMVNMKNESIFIDDISSNLNSTNARLKICFGKEFEWNKDWSGLWVKSWKQIEQWLL